MMLWYAEVGQIAPDDLVTLMSGPLGAAPHDARPVGSFCHSGGHDLVLEVEGKRVVLTESWTPRARG